MMATMFVKRPSKIKNNVELQNNHVELQNNQNNVELQNNPLLTSSTSKKQAFVVVASDKKDLEKFPAENGE